MASLLLTDSYSLATSRLQSLYANLPASLRDPLASVLQTIQRSLPHQKAQAPASLFERASNIYSINTLTSVAAIVGPLLILLYSLMSWWPSTSGRYSPFTSFYSRSGPPPVTEDDYSYLSAEDHRSGRIHRDDDYSYPSSNMTSQTQGRGSRSDNTSRRAPEAADLAPDVLILRHKNATYPLHFRPFSIAEGDLRVHDVRQQAADELRVEDPRRVKLLYKGKQLRDDKESCKHENLKQNSEIMCVVSSQPVSRDGDSSSDSGSVSTAAANGHPTDGLGIPFAPGEDKKKRKGHRGGNKKKRNPDRDAGAKDPAFLSPPAGPGTSISRSSSPAAPPLKKPSTPAEALEQIQDNFNAAILPDVQAFLANPPPRGKERDFEYKKLSESILAQVLLKLDGVETMGNEVLRGRRKEIVRRVQGYLTDLDVVGKR